MPTGLLSRVLGLPLPSADLWSLFWPDASQASSPRLIGDKAYDSDPLDRTLDEDYGIELIAPNRRGRTRKTQDGRSLRRYKRRWKAERLFAWLHNFRRLVTRWEYHVENFLGFVHLGCLKILLRHL